MRYACIRRYEGAFTVVLMCRVLEVGRAGYYAWRRRPPSARAQADTPLRVAIRAIHTASHGRYGRPRIHRALRAQQVCCSPKRVARLMRLEGLRGARGRRFRRTTQADGTPPAPNRLQRRFHVARPHQVWVSDVTACWTAEGWLYLAVVLDAFSRRVIGWALGRTLEAALAVAALRMALMERQPAPGLVHHSDRGVQYASADYTGLLKQHQAAISMSRKGNPYDNAACESFMKTLKYEEVYRNEYRDFHEAHASIGGFLELVYNQKRLHSALGYVPPAEFERGTAQ